jgi:hypothetical protein
MNLLGSSASFQLQKRIDRSLPILEGRTQFAPTLIANPDDVAQRDGLASQLG